ncbi:hypothetical protein H2248_008865 [Termitomyces sp. 'cryptogamus']|nr:hypothetical protein H2248_008865 [Termitomyces sp. 'cryptogamus']
MMSLAAPLPPLLLRDYPVFVPPPPQPKLQLPNFYAFKLDLSRLWLTRTPRKFRPRPKQPEHVDLNSRATSGSSTKSDDHLKPRPRPRTPVFTRPPLPVPTLDSKPLTSLGHTGPTASFIVNVPFTSNDSYPFSLIRPLSPPSPQMPMPIKLPQLLPFKLTLPSDETEAETTIGGDGAGNLEEVYDWANQPSVVFSPMGDVDSVRERACSGTGTRRARYVSPLLRSPSPSPSPSSSSSSSRDVLESLQDAWPHEWDRMRMAFENEAFFEFVDHEPEDSEDSESSHGNDDNWVWSSFMFDDSEAYLGDAEDSYDWSDSSEDEADPIPPEEDGDCFVWLDDEIKFLFAGFEEVSY